MTACGERSESVSVRIISAHGAREGRERLEEKETEQDDDTLSSNTLKWFISLKNMMQVACVMYLSVWLSQGHVL